VCVPEFSEKCRNIAQPRRFQWGARDEPLPVVKRTQATGRDEAMRHKLPSIRAHQMPAITEGDCTERGDLLLSVLFRKTRISTGCGSMENSE